ncbi:M23 family metallopeptidase [Kribbella sp. NPDC059898]|uniref:M23 family metallopeptidase n=1 Tax=Kribbella sp. NPDC059898 TaxID=3346995 RepID=UPI00365253D9
MDPATAKFLLSVLRQPGIRKLLVVILVGLVLGGLVTLIGIPLGLMILLTGGTPAQAVTPPTADCRPNVGALEQVTAEQTSNAAIIVSVGQRHKIPEYGLVIALATAMQESNLINLHKGDRDSQGLFQQRPSSGWGTIAQITNPTLAAEAFYGLASHTKNPGLVDIKGWQAMSLTVAAQAVQHSAYPLAYAKHEPLARQLLGQLLNLPGGQLTCGNGNALNCPASGLGVEEGLTPDALRVLRCVHQQFPQLVSFGGVGERETNPQSDHPSGRAVDAMIPDWEKPEGKALGDQVAAYTVSNAKGLGVKYVIWNAKIWSVERQKEGWRPYTHPSGATDATSMHLDHVHVSVYGNAASDSSGGGDFVLPVDKGAYHLTARFNDSGSNWQDKHTGLDFAAPSGTPIKAVTAGQVTAVLLNGGPYGRLTKIQHTDGVESWYAHQSDQAVKVGQLVKAGEVIGRVGNSGNTTGPHLHLEIRKNGVPVDPDTWLKAHGVTP